MDNEQALLQRAREIADRDATAALALAARAVDVCVKRGQGAGYREAAALLPLVAQVCAIIGG